MLRSFASIVLLACAVPLLSGCFLIKKPNKANIQLRKENQQLQTQLAELQRKAEADAAMIRSLQNRIGTLPTLPRDRLNRLFTTHDIKLGRLTGPADLDSSKPGYEGLKVYVTPIDQSGDGLKAAGSFTVEAYDLSRDGNSKIGTWKFDLDAAREQWYSVLNRYNYVLPCPWQTPPGEGTLHIEVTFIDELTQGEFKESVDVTVQPPAATSSNPPVPGS